MGSPCTAVVSTCKGDGSGNYDVAPEAFSVCVDQPAINGVCGTANGTTVAVAPSGAALCSAGTPSAVTGSGPWSWTCAGQYGGANSPLCQAFKSALPCTQIFTAGQSYIPEPPDPPYSHVNPSNCSISPPSAVVRGVNLTITAQKTLQGLIDTRLADGKLTAGERTNLMTYITSPEFLGACTQPDSETKRCIYTQGGMEITADRIIDFSDNCTATTYLVSSASVVVRTCDPPPPACTETGANYATKLLCEAVNSSGVSCVMGGPYADKWHCGWRCDSTGNGDPCSIGEHLCGDGTIQTNCGGHLGNDCNCVGGRLQAL